MLRVSGPNYFYFVSLCAVCCCFSIVFILEGLDDTLDVLVYNDKMYRFVV